MSTLRARLSTRIRRWRRDPIAARLLGGALGTFSIKTAGTLLLHTRSFVLAALMGPASYGLFAYVLAWTILIGRTASLGLPTLVLRTVAAAPEDAARIRAHLRASARLVSGLGLAAGATFWALTTILLAPTHPLRVVVPWVVGLPALLALSWLLASTLQGLARPVLSQIGHFVIVPGLVIVAVLALRPVIPANVETILVLHQLALVGALIFYHLVLNNIVPFAGGSETPSLRISTTIPFATSTVLSMLQLHVGTLVVGTLAGPAEAAIFDLAQRGSTLVAFVMTVVTIPLAPMVARLYHEDRRRLWRALDVARAVSLVGAVLMTLAYALFAPPLLATMGDAYRAAYVPLLVLSVGQIASAAFGPLGWILNMTGYERQAARDLGIGVAVQTILAIGLATDLGALGGAIAGAIGLCIWKACLRLSLRKVLRAGDCRQTPSVDTSDPRGARR